MTGFFLTIYDLLATRKALHLSAFAVVTALLLAVAWGLRYDEDVYDFLPLEPEAQRAMAVYQDISRSDRVVVFFSMKDGSRTDASRLCEAVDAFERGIDAGAGRGLVRDMVCRLDYEAVAGLQDFVYANLPLMLTDSDYVAMERWLRVPGYADSLLAADAEMLLLPASGVMAGGVERDPLMLFAPVLDRLRGLLAALPYDVVDGRIFTSDRKHAVVMLSSPYGAVESSGNALLADYVDSVACLTMRAMPDVVVSQTGAPVIAALNARQVRRDGVFAVSVSVVLILSLLVFCFRSFRNLSAMAAAVAFGWLAGLAGLAVFAGCVSTIVLGMGSIVIGIAVNYPLHFIVHARGHSPRVALGEIASPLFTGNVTTVAAFACLTPLEAPALCQFGVFAASMLVGTMLFTVVFLPHFVKCGREPRAGADLSKTLSEISEHSENCEICRRPSQSVSGEKKRRLDKAASLFKGSRLLRSFALLRPERHRWLLVPIAVMTAVLGWLGLDTSFDADMQHVCYMPPEQERLLSALGTAYGPADTARVYVVSQGRSWDEALALAERLPDYGQGRVTAFVPSLGEQARRIALWRRFWAGHGDSVLAAIEGAALRQGFRADGFAPFREIISGDYAPQPFEHFEPLVSTVLQGNFSRAGGCSVVETIEAPLTPPLGGCSPPQNGGVRRGSGGGLEGGLGSFAFGFRQLNCSIADALSSDFNYICFACSFVVLLFLWLSFRSLRTALLAFVPMAVGWIWILGCMEAMGMRFNIVTAVLATFIFGQGDDYTIFMVEGLIARRRGQPGLLPAYRRSMLLSAVIMLIGIGSLVTARHPALRSLGEVTIVGMLTVVAMAWLLPPLLDFMIAPSPQSYQSPQSTRRTQSTRKTAKQSRALKRVATFIKSRANGESEAATPD